MTQIPDSHLHKIFFAKSSLQNGNEIGRGKMQFTLNFMNKFIPTSNRDSFVPLFFYCLFMLLKEQIKEIEKEQMKSRRKQFSVTLRLKEIYLYVFMIVLAS